MNKPPTDVADAGEGGAGAPPPVQERNRVHGLKRDYRNDSIVVHWYAERCIHSAACVMAMRDVFDPQRRPWIVLDGHSADEIARAVEKCPTGALMYTRLDGGPQEQPPETTTMQPIRNGPLLVRESPRLAFCRCGRSSHMPFCDNTHRQIGFREPEPQ